MTSHADPAPVPGKRRILCVDGGGIVGTFPAAFLAGLEQHLDQPIGRYFDLIVGTSTGGILALGLGMGFPASRLLDLYETRGPEIFGQHRGRFRNVVAHIWRCVQWTYRRKHDAGPLHAALTDVFGDRCLGHAQTRLLIPAWNPVARRVYIYKTAHHQRLKSDYKARAVDAALATAAAPTYFDRHVTPQGVGLLDGGVWANNPTALAVVEAITLLGWHPNSLQVLSLGCLDEVYDFPSGAGLGTLCTKVMKLFMDGQSHGAMGIAQLLTGHEHERTAIYRITHTVPSDKYKLDNTSKIRELKGLGFAQARDREPHLAPVFFDAPADRFDPIYKLDGEGATPPATRG
ncbi:MAG: CBASS cGAMP-activated phospholipase [Gammaproteobacteria bacterium]